MISTGENMGTGQCPPLCPKGDCLLSLCSVLLLMVESRRLVPIFCLALQQGAPFRSARVCFVNASQKGYPQQTVAAPGSLKQQSRRFPTRDCFKHDTLVVRGGHGLVLGPPVVPFLTPFLGEGSPTKVDYRKELAPLF